MAKLGKGEGTKLGEDESINGQLQKNDGHERTKLRKNARTNGRKKKGP